MSDVRIAKDILPVSPERLADEPPRMTPLQVLQDYLFSGIDEAARVLNPEELDALRQIVVMRMDAVADQAIWE